MMSRHSVDNDTLSCPRDLYTNMPRCLHLLQPSRVAFAPPHPLAFASPHSLVFASPHSLAFASPHSLAFASPHSLPSPSKSAAQQSHMAFSSARVSAHISDTHPPNNICIFGSVCVYVCIWGCCLYVYMDLEIVCQRLVQTCAHPRLKYNSLG